MIRVGILTASDKGSAGERVDESGAAIAELAETAGARVAARAVVPDDPEVISGKLVHMADELGVDVIFTTGGTGLSPRDHTPEATLAVIDREVPGIAEAIRAHGRANTPRAILSRGVAGVRGRTLIVNLPGSPRGVREGMQVLLPVLSHAVEVLRGEVSDCATSMPELSPSNELEG